MSQGDGDPVLMGLIRASYQRDSAAREQLAGQIACPDKGAPWKRLIVSISLVLGLILDATSVRAMELGSLGPTYEIGEPHLLQMIEQRLREKERNGELKHLENKLWSGVSRP